MRVQCGRGVFVLTSRAGMDSGVLKKQKGKGGNFREIWCVAYLVLGTFYLYPLCMTRRGLGREEHIFCASIIERASEPASWRFCSKNPEKWHWSCKHESFSLVYLFFLFHPVSRLVVFFSLVLHEGRGGGGEHIHTLYIRFRVSIFLFIRGSQVFIFFYVLFTWSK